MEQIFCLMSERDNWWFDKEMFYTVLGKQKALPNSVQRWVWLAERNYLHSKT